VSLQVTPTMVAAQPTPISVSSPMTMPTPAAASPRLPIASIQVSVRGALLLVIAISGNFDYFQLKYFGLYWEKTLLRSLDKILGSFLLPIVTDWTAV
jgi:hypothetical protein